MKKLSDGTYKVTKKEKKIVKEFVINFVGNQTVQVKNEIEHKIALDLIKAGQAKIVRKKNYGKIAEIENLEFEF